MTVSLPHHIIQQKVFDIHIKRKDRYAILQNRFSRLFNNELFSMLETFIDREIQPNFDFRIETMTVDLGTVTYEHLEQDITRIFIESFQKALHEITGDISVAHTSETVIETKKDSSDRHLEVIEFFLLTGILPWWADTEKYADPLTITDELILKKKYAFRELLYRIGTSEIVRKRLAWQFPETHIRSVIKILEPDKAAFIFQYHDEVTALQEDQQLVQSETKEFEKSVWLFVLDYLLVDRGSIFEERSFVKSSIYKMAMFFNVQYEDLLIAFYRAVQLVPPALKKSGGLGLLIEYVYNDHFLQHHDEESIRPEPVNEAASEEVLLLRKLKTVQYYLAHGSFPFESAFTTKESVAGWLNELVEKSPSFFAKVLTEWVQNKPVQQQRLFQLLDVSLLKKISLALAAGSATIINRYFEILQLLHQDSTAIITEMLKDKFIYQSAFAGMLFFREHNANVQEFIKKHLLTVSAHYGIDHKKIARALLQAVIQQHGKNSHHKELVAGITALLAPGEKEAVLSVLHQGAATDNVFWVRNALEEKAHDPTANIEWLQFYLHYGFLPWWAPEKDETKVPRYIDELIAANAGKALSLFKPLMAKDSLRRRLIVQLSPVQLIQWVKKLPGANSGIKAYEELLLLLKSSSIADYISIDNADELVVMLFLEEYAAAGNAFSAQHFIASVIKQLTQLLNTDPVFIIYSFEKAIEKESEKYSPELQQALRAVAAEYHMPQSNLLHSIPEIAGKDLVAQFQKVLDNGSITIRTKKEWQELINELLHYTGTEPDKITLSKEANAIIHQYVIRFSEKSNSIPAARDFLKKLLTTENPHDIIKGISGNELPVLLKEIILIAYKKDVAGLKELLQSLPITSPGFDMLYRLFSNTTTIEERNAFYLLRTTAEQKLIDWLRQDKLFIQNTTAQNLPEIISAVIAQNNGELFIRLLQTNQYNHWLLPVSLPYINDHIVDQLFAVFQPGVTQHLVSFIKEFRALLRQVKLLSIDSINVLKAYKHFLLELLSGKIKAISAQDLVKAFFDYGEQYDKSLMFRFYGSLANKIGEKGTNNPVLSLLLPQLQQELTQRIEVHSKHFSFSGKGATGSLKAHPSDATLMMQLKNELNRKKIAEEKSMEQINYPALEEPDIEKIYIPNAGLVLLHPFLSFYFSNLGLLEKGKFTSTIAQQRAIHLLAFVTDGKEEHAEHTLPLNKILCGFPLPEPVDHTFSIQVNERELSIQMLKVIFQRWDKLKNSTVEGFRDSFLKRQGILTRTGEGWNLRVDQRGYDVLLETIPWGFRFIKLSWMNEILTVQWM